MSQMLKKHIAVPLRCIVEDDLSSSIERSHDTVLSVSEMADMDSRIINLNDDSSRSSVGTDDSRHFPMLFEDWPRMIDFEYFHNSLLEIGIKIEEQDSRRIFDHLDTDKR